VIGDSLSQQLVTARLAVPYAGKKKNTDWANIYKEWRSYSA